MSALQAVGVSLLCALCALVLRECKSPLFPLISLSGGLLLLLFLLPKLSSLLEALPLFEGQAVGALLGEMGKILAVGFIVGIGCDVCTELGAPTLASRLDFFGKVEILLLSLPTLKELFLRVEELLS